MPEELESGYLSDDPDVCVCGHHADDHAHINPDKSPCSVYGCPCEAYELQDEEDEP